jgi:uncharacterized membrane protein
MSSTLLLIIALLGIALVALVIAWFLAGRVKRRLDDEPPGVAGASATVRIAPANAHELRALTTEPILLKQTVDGVRVQIDDRPMVPLAVFMGKDVSAALRETSVAVSDVFGPLWTVLVTAREGGEVTVSRLS